MCFRHDPIPVTLSNPLFSILIGFSQLSIVCLEFPFNPWHQHLCHWIKTPHSSFAPHKTHLFNIFFLLQSLVLSMKGPNFLNTCRFIPIFRKFEQVVTDIRKVSHWNIFLQIFQSTRSLHMSRCRTQKSLFLPMAQQKIKHCWMLNSTTYWHLSCIGVSNLSFLISLSPSPHQIPSSSFRPTRTKRGEIIGTHRPSYWLVGPSTQRPGYWRCHHRRSNTCTFPLRKHG